MATLENESKRERFTVSAALLNKCELLRSAAEAQHVIIGNFEKLLVRLGSGADKKPAYMWLETIADNDARLPVAGGALALSILRSNAQGRGPLLPEMLKLSEKELAELLCVADFLVFEEAVDYLSALLLSSCLDLDPAAQMESARVALGLPDDDDFDRLVADRRSIMDSELARVRPVDPEQLKRVVESVQEYVDAQSR